MESPVDLTAKLLIAMPGMGDARFDRSVIFLCAHSEDGAMGLIVNKPATGLALGDLLDQLGIKAGRGSIRLPVHAGGPVEHGRGFVLHSADYARRGSTLGIDERFGMTATLEILEDIAKGEGPKSAILALGYAGWGPGQLEDEILRNGWLTCEASEDLVFGTENAEKWAGALQKIGVDARLLSSSAGRA
jgi:putative transcriptional regulator